MRASRRSTASNRAPSRVADRAATPTEGRAGKCAARGAAACEASPTAPGAPGEAAAARPALSEEAEAEGSPSPPPQAMSIDPAQPNQAA